MQYFHTLEKATHFAALAMDKIHAHQLPPHPENFEVWYVYFSGENPELTRAVDTAIKNKAMTPEHCQELYGRYLSDSSESERVKVAGDRIQSTLKDVNSIVSNVKTATSKFRNTLTNVATKLSDSPDRAEIEIVLKTVMANTEDMIKQNQMLESELTKSSRAMVELQRDLELVRKEAMTDSLTSLANRKCFDSEIRRIIQEAEGSGQTFCLIMLDIDHFKSFNDNYGHQVGDQVLRLVARTLTDGVKGRDVAARFGGEEFAIILPDTNLQGGVKVGDYLRKAVAGKEVVNRNTGDTLGRITLSGGVAQFMPGENPDALIERADAALYSAKHNGRNQIAAAPPPGAKKTAV